MEHESIVFYGTMSEVDDPALRSEYIKQIASDYGLPFRHGSEVDCQVFVIDLDYATSRDGRFKPKTQRELYVYDFKK